MVHPVAALFGQSEPDDLTTCDLVIIASSASAKSAMIANSLARAVTSTSKRFASDKSRPMATDVHSIHTFKVGAADFRHSLIRSNTVGIAQEMLHSLLRIF